MKSFMGKRQRLRDCFPTLNNIFWTQFHHTKWTKSRLLYFCYYGQSLDYCNVHAVQSGCMDHKWNKKIRIQLQSKKGKPSAIYLCMAPVSMPKVHGFKHRSPKQSRSQDIFLRNRRTYLKCWNGCFCCQTKRPVSRSKGNAELKSSSPFFGRNFKVVFCGPLNPEFWFIAHAQVIIILSVKSESSFGFGLLLRRSII